ncbi:hypothetical protein [Streptomyces flaveus]|nr:hypothetical protein [Streptomyces flaveus]
MNHPRPQRPPFSRRVALAGFAGAALAGTTAFSADASAAPGSTYRRTVRFATFNASLNRGAQGALVTDLSTPDNQQARNAADLG